VVERRSGGFHLRFSARQTQRSNETSAPNSVLSRTGASGDAFGHVAKSRSTTTNPAARKPVATHGTTRCQVGSVPAIMAAPVSSGAPASRSSICTRASPMSRSRRFGSLSRQRRRSSRRRGDTAGGSARQFGSVFSTDANVSEIVAPVNSRSPVSISKTTTPNAHMSARLSTGFPRACSGLM